jgi:predicted nucleic acid-binding protein
LDLVIPALVVTEVTQLIERRMGAAAEAKFLRGLAKFAIEPPTVEDWPRIADVVERYGDFPLGTVDASVVVLADRLGTDLIVTLDRRHFGTVLSPAGRRFRLLPEMAMAHEDLAPYPEPGP